MVRVIAPQTYGFSIKMPKYPNSAHFGTLKLLELVVVVVDVAATA